MSKEIEQHLTDALKNVESDGANRAIAIIRALHINDKDSPRYFKSFKIDWCMMSNGSVYPEIDIEFHPS